MIKPAYFCDKLAEYGIDFYTGVPDSLLKSLCAYIDANLPASQHVITANEGNAVALACGHYLGCNRPAAVYMQNSGLGNTVNPLTSLADPLVYSVPMLLIIGWRGEPNVKDEPQHIKQGAITKQQLDVLDIPYVEVDAACQLNSALPSLVEKMLGESRPVALLIKANTFDDYKAKKVQSNYSLTREQAIGQVVALTDPADLIVATTGKASRELFEHRKNNNMENNDFLTVGAMGHTASIALGVAKAQPNKRVVVIDGDGSLLMHMGSMAVIAQQKLANLVHVVLNNGCHESVGGQATVANLIDLPTIALACGYSAVYSVTDEAGLAKIWHSLPSNKTCFIEVKINASSRTDLGRPSSSPIENKIAFMQHAQRT